MPAPQASMMQQFAKLQFSSFGIQLPSSPAYQMVSPKLQWKDKGGNSSQYDNAFKSGELTAVPMPAPPKLFLAYSPNEYHVDTQKEISDQFEAYINKMCSAICSAWSTWQSTAVLVGVLVAGPVASGGTVTGVPWGSLILGQGPMSTAMEMKYTAAIANVIGTAWLAYSASIMVPGLPWYPAFAAFPGPVTPPTPNIPASLAMLQAPAKTMISKSVLKAQMIAAIADPKAPHHVELCDAIADAFEKCHQIWEPSTMVTNVLGFGPVPSFAPPFAPVGPVVGGMGTMTPGGFV